MKTQHDPVATSSMLIRKPVSMVFEAMADPVITSRFWFTKGSGRLEPGKTVKWEWEQFGIQADIKVTEVERNRLISFQWPVDEDGTAIRTVDISFEPRSADTTFVNVIEKGFVTGNENLVEEISGQTEGWTLVLSGMKAFLEHGINLNLISDHKPVDIKADNKKESGTADLTELQPEVQIVKEFNASSEMVFDAWLDPEKIGRWMFGPGIRDEEILKLELNPIVGGAYSFVVRRGEEVINHLGRYLVLERPRRLEFTWGIESESEEESVVSIEIEPAGKGCKLTLTHKLDPKWKEYADRTHAAWSRMLDELEEVISEEK